VQVTAYKSFEKSFLESKNIPYIFCIMPYNLHRKREIVKQIVFQETVLFCISSSDMFNGSSNARDKIRKYISEAKFVIVDLTRSRLACVYEMGIAIGSNQVVRVIRKKTRKKLPFGVDSIKDTQYTNQINLKKLVSNICAPYRKRIFNLELIKPSTKEFKPVKFGLPDWYNHKYLIETRPKRIQFLFAFITSISLGFAGFSLSYHFGLEIVSSFGIGATLSLTILGVFYTVSKELQKQLAQIMSKFNLLWLILIIILIFISAIMLF